MDKIITGKTYVLGKNIDTDQIYPGIYVQYTDPEDVAKYALAGYDPNFAKNFVPGSLLIADTNFGCGSSREHAAITLKGIGVSAVIAESFGRIFYRNAINLGLPVIICKGVHALFQEGEQASVDLASGEIRNETTGKSLQAVPFSEYIWNILANGGIKPMIRKQLQAQQEG